MSAQLPNLTTPDSKAGLRLAGELAEQLRAQMDQAEALAELPGGVNYRQPAPVSKEVIAGILFYAIAAANRGWVRE